MKVKVKVKQLSTADTQNIERILADCEKLYQENRDLRRYVDILKDEIAVHREEKSAFEDVIRSFDEARKDYEAEIARVCQEKQELYKQIEENATARFYAFLEEHNLLANFEGGPHNAN